MGSKIWTRAWGKKKHKKKKKLGKKQSTISIEAILQRRKTVRSLRRQLIATGLDNVVVKKKELILVYKNGKMSRQGVGGFEQGIQVLQTILNQRKKS